jgi:hypothetical protein
VRNAPRPRRGTTRWDRALLMLGEAPLLVADGVAVAWLDVVENATDEACVVVVLAVIED